MPRTTANSTTRSADDAEMNLTNRDLAGRRTAISAGGLTVLTTRPHTRFIQNKP